MSVLPLATLPTSCALLVLLFLLPHVSGVRILSYMPAYKCLDGSSTCIAGTPNLAFLSGTSMAAPVITGQVAMCYEKGICKANSTTELAKIVRVAGTYSRSNRDYGFKGDTLQPVAGKHYGYLVYGNAY